MSLPNRSLALILLPLLVGACRSSNDSQSFAAAQDSATVEAKPQDAGPIPGAERCDDLIMPGEEKYISKLWKITSGGENAEAYWSYDGSRLVMQTRRPADGIDCDQIFVTTPEGTKLVSAGGVTTCSYFLPSDDKVLFASTHAAAADCPPAPDRSQGYVWALYPTYDVWQRDLKTGDLTPLITGPGYDAEATVSPRGDRMVFTSTRSGDIELWTCALDGSDVKQVTDEIGYDGGAFFSHDGEKLVFRSTAFTPGKEEAEQADYKRLLAQNLVRPSHMELYVCNADGTGRKQITRLGGANFAPFFTPDDKHILFSSNHHDTNKPAMNFDLFMVPVEGGDVVQVTHYNESRGKQFDSFPMFSPNGKYLAFASNRGDGEAGETNVFVAEWR